MIGTGIGIPSAFAADFAAGTTGSALEQMLTGVRVDADESLLAGAQNALDQLVYGTGELKSAGNAFARGARTGAVSAALDNLADAFGIRGGGQADDPGSSYGGQQAGMTTWPGTGAGRDPRRLCGASDPFDRNGLGDGNTRGYQFGRNHSTAGGTQESGGFSLGGFVRDTLTGAVLGGLGSAGFYGAGRAVEVLRGSVGRSRGGRESRADFYVTPSGDVVPSVGYRYMSSNNATSVLNTGKQYSTYIGFNKYDSAYKARDAFQISPNWSDCKIRGTFDTLQVIDDMYVPTTLGNTTTIPEPFTTSYPKYGSGGIQQFRVDKVISFQEVKIIGD